MSGLKGRDIIDTERIIRLGVAPSDDHNQTLIHNVSPPTWTNPEPSGRYHLVVIGAGTAGLISAAFAAGAGARVALIERHLMGGDCLNVGCVPSKSLIRSSRVFRELQNAAALGWHIPEGAEADFAQVMRRMRALRAQISAHDSAWRYRDQKGIDVYFGSACFTGPDTLEVAGKTLHFRKAVIATGARAAIPPIEGLTEVEFLTNETVFNLTECPRRLAVIGGGPIGTELAQAFNRLGAEVTLFEAGPQLLGKEDPEAVAIIQKVMSDEGVHLILGCQLQRIETTATDKVLYYQADGSLEKISVDAIFVGTGRTPNVEGLGLEAAGVYYTQHGITTTDDLRTTNAKIYTAGDVAMQWKFTHAAEDAARIAVQNALFPGRRKLGTLTMPWCTYTDPEIAHVGIHEEEARKRGFAVDTFVHHWSDVDRAITDGDDEGFVKIYAKKGTEQILGGTIVARHAGEMISELTLAIVGKIGLKKLASVIHPYPTQADAIRRAAFAYNMTRVTPFAKKLLGLWLRFTR
jgi:pyruvate/2-oxoglutarate dehydrogenase complex dihydrolipoamide dehydrogenase (E3) component